MKLTKAEAQKISNEYDLGKVISISPLEGGWVNPNQILKTERGKYVVRILGVEYNKKKKEQLELEFVVLKELRSKKFPYLFPYPLENKKGIHISKIRKKTFWVYEFIEGEVNKSMNIKKLKEVAKVMALYHKAVKGIKGKPHKLNLDFIESRYKKIFKTKSKKKVSLFTKKNLPLMEESLEYSKKIDFNENLVPCHFDLHSTNIIYSKNKVKGIIDFDNIKFYPRIMDISHFVKSCLFEESVLKKEWFNAFLKEYNKHNKLSKKEERMIFPMIIYYNNRFFELFSREDGWKTPESSLHLLNWIVNTTKGSMREVGLK